MPSKRFEIAVYCGYNQYDESAPVFFTGLKHLAAAVPKGYVEALSVEVEFAVPSRESLVAAKIAGLRAEIQEKRVEAEVECRQKEELIQNLLALSYDRSGS